MFRIAPIVLLLSLLFWPASAVATSYVMMSDDDLVTVSSAIVEARVVDRVAAPITETIATDYLIEVDRLVKGAVPGSSLVVRVVGGENPDGTGLKIWGAPRFGVGEKVLLFLTPADDGTYRIVHLMLGAFHQVDVGVDSYAIRLLDEVEEIPNPQTGQLSREEQLPRRYGEFVHWLGERAAGRAAPASYFEELDPGQLNSIQERFTLLVDGPTGLSVRWFEFDTGGFVTWQAFASGQPGIAGGAFDQFRSALGAWTFAAQTGVDLRYGGTSGRQGGFADTGDGFNTMIYNDPNNTIGTQYSCTMGGTIAIGGPRFNRGVQGTFRGQTYIRALEAEIVMNKNLECFFAAAGPKSPEAIYGHELGHTLGLGHSCGDSASGPCNTDAKLNALMRATATNASRGALLNSDDRNGLKALYGPRQGGGGGGGQAPTAPSGLAAELDGLTALLTWTDESDNEESFRVYRGVNGALTRIADLPAGSNAFVDEGLAAGTTYRYQVAAANSRNERRSSEVVVETPAELPVSITLDVTGLPANPGSGTVLAFAADVSGPVETVEWDFGNGTKAYSYGPCAPSRFCAPQIYTGPGSFTVTATAVGDVEQTASDQQIVSIGGATPEFQSRESLVQSVIFGQRGNTGTFESNCWIHNAGSQPALVELTYLPRGAGNPNPDTRGIVVEAASSVFLPNVLGEFFETSDTQGSIGLEYKTPDGTDAPDVRTLCRSFVDIEGKLGSFGQFVGEERAETWSAADKVVTGILFDDSFGATLLAANIDDTPGAVRITLLDGAGQAVDSPVDFGLGSRTMRFRPIQQIFPSVETAQGPFTAVFSSVNGIRFVASTTLLEKESEDQIFIAAREPDNANPVIVPRVATSQSQFDAFLVSQMVARNNSSLPTQLTIELWLRGQNNSTPQTVQQTIPGNGTLVVDDVIRDLFGLETGVGALKITWANAANVAPRIQTYAFNQSDGGAGQRFGKLVDSLPMAAGSNAATVDFGAEQSTLFRANFGIVNLNPNLTVVDVTLREAFGEELFTTRISLQPQQQLERSLEGIFRDVMVGRGTNWTVETEVVTGGPVITYLANINASGDIFFVPGRGIEN